MRTKLTAKCPKAIKRPIRRAFLHPPGLWKCLYVFAVKWMRMQSHEKEFPESIAAHLPDLCRCVADPRLLCTDGRESENYRFVFCRAFMPSPERFLELVGKLVAFRRGLNPNRIALRDYPEIGYTEHGKITVKDINEASSKEIVSFIEEEFGESTTDTAVAKLRQRLAKEDRQRVNASARTPGLSKSRSPTSNPKRAKKGTRKVNSGPLL